MEWMKMSKEKEFLVHALDRLKHINFEDDHLTNDLIQTIQKYLAQPEQEPVYWENEKKALLNEIDHLTNRLAQPELSTDSLQLDEQDLREDLRECLRDRFAGLAMQRLLVGYSAPAYKDAAKLSYQMADAMLIAREAGL